MALTSRSRRAITCSVPISRSVRKLRQVDVLSSQGKSVAEAIRSIGVTDVAYYRWRSECGGLEGDQVKRLKELETENSRLRGAASLRQRPGPAELFCKQRIGDPQRQELSRVVLAVRKPGCEGRDNSS